MKIYESGKLWKNWKPVLRSPGQVLKCKKKKRNFFVSPNSGFLPLTPHMVNDIVICRTVYKEEVSPPREILEVVR